MSHNILKKFLDVLIPEDDTLSEEEPEPNGKEIKKYLDSLEFESDYTILDGPFAPQEYVLKSKEHFHSNNICCCKSNLMLIRNFVLLCKDYSFSTRDNSRMKLSINPYGHHINLYARSNNGSLEFDIVTVDDFFLEKESDKLKIKNLLQKFPPQENELRSARIIT